MLVLDKPVGSSSNRAVQVVRRLLGRVKAGHIGTLDPFASGVLPVLLGTATRLAPYHVELAKTYEATLALGRATETLDVEGAVVEERAFDHVDQDRLRRAMVDLSGEQEQAPPRYSARKVGGRRLYELARQGIDVPRVAKRVSIHAFELRDYDPGAGVVRFFVDVSSGTYVRVLGDELARACGTCGHLTALRRLSVGPYTLDGAVPPDRAAEPGVIVPPERLLPELRPHVLDAAGVEAMGFGRPVALAAEPPIGVVRLLAPDGQLVALAEARARDDGTWELHPRLVLAPFARS